MASSQQEVSSPTIMGQLRSKLRRMHPSMISDDGSEDQCYINPEGLLRKKQKSNIYSIPQQLGLNPPVIEGAHIQPYAFHLEEVLPPYPNVPPLASDAVVTQKKQKSSNLEFYASHLFK